jgi:glycosyltransferase involved in cell wall biosynthesis
MPAKKKLPFVSVCTPTYNRRCFIEMMFHCFRNQTYPKNRMEWIIVDDGTDKIRDLVEKSGIPQIKYFELPEKISLGAKRNLMHKYTSGDKDSIIVYQDDDDYYPPERVAHAVERLMQNPAALCAGSSEIYIYFKHINKMYQAGPYGPNHATAGTFAFRKRLLDDHKYNDAACLAEEKEFLKNYTVPFVQLDPLKTILVFSHIQNTFDKKKLLDNQHPQFFKESAKTVNMFIRQGNEKPIWEFFMKDIDNLLANYAPGDPSMKPDVLVQMKEIEKERDKIMREAQERAAAAGGGGAAAGTPQIVMQREGQPPVVMSIENAVNLLTQQHKTIDELIRRSKEMQERIKELEYIVSMQGGGGGGGGGGATPVPISWGAQPQPQHIDTPRPPSVDGALPQLVFNNTIRVV